MTSRIISGPHKVGDGTNTDSLNAVLNWSDGVIYLELYKGDRDSMYFGTSMFLAECMADLIFTAHELRALAALDRQTKKEKAWYPGNMARRIYDPVSIDYTEPKYKAALNTKSMGNGLSGEQSDLYVAAMFVRRREGYYFRDYASYIIEDVPGISVREARYVKPFTISAEVVAKMADDVDALFSSIPPIPWDTDDYTASYQCLAIERAIIEKGGDATVELDEDLWEEAPDEE